MSDLKHTPGPWQYAGGDNYSCEVNIGPTTVCLSRCSKNSDSLEIERSEMEANAKLIAAAPELLEALLIVINDDPTFLEIDKIQAAIKKATE